MKKKLTVKEREAIIRKYVNEDSAYWEWTCETYYEPSITFNIKMLEELGYDQKVIEGVTAEEGEETTWIWALRKTPITPKAHNYGKFGLFNFDTDNTELDNDKVLKRIIKEILDKQVAEGEVREAYEEQR